MNAVKDISGALVHKIPDHPILPLSMPEVLQLFTNEFVSNICVRNICLVMRQYNNTFLYLVSLVSSLSPTIKNQDTHYMIISIIIEMVTKGDLADGWWMMDDECWKRDDR